MTSTNGRLDPLGPPSLDAAQQALYDHIAGGRRAAAHPKGTASGLTDNAGGLRGPFNSYLRTPEIGMRLSELGEALRFDAEMPRDLLELAIICVGRHTTAQFEWFAHARMARDAGVSDAVIDAIARRERPQLEGAAESVYDFTQELLADHRVSDAVYAGTLEAIGERQVVELTALVGFYLLISGVLNVFEVPLPEGVEPLAP